MKIPLEYPFNRYFRNGSLVTNNQNRKNVLLSNYGSKVTTTSYSRYLMSVKLKRFLREDEHVDHKDNDKTNDNIDNLQILTRAENNLKHTREVINGRRYYLLECPVCFKHFERESRQIDCVTTSTCSRKCGGILSHRKNAIKKIILKEFRKITTENPILGYKVDEIEDDDFYVPDWVIRCLPDKNALVFNTLKLSNQEINGKCVVCLNKVPNENMLYCSDSCYENDPIRKPKNRRS